MANVQVVYVNPQKGNDKYNGTVRRPFATIQAAVDAAGLFQNGVSDSRTVVKLAEAYYAEDVDLFGTDGTLLVGITFIGDSTYSSTIINSIGISAPTTKLRQFAMHNIEVYNNCDFISNTSSKFGNYGAELINCWF